MNPFKYSNDNKRYQTLNYFYKNKFHTKVFKISLDAGFTCPNLDGTKGYGGCLYCEENKIKKIISNKELLKQFQEKKKEMLKKWPNSKYIGYFQSNSNTYAPLNILKEKYELILKEKDIVGLNIATRADCIKEDTLSYLKELNQRTFLTIELGLQSIHEKTTKLINRHHDLKTFEETVKKLRQEKINVVIHIINGLPYETKEMMLETVSYLSKLNIQGIKIHMLYITKGSKMANFWKEKKFPLLTKEEYLDIVSEQLAIIPKEIVIHRLTGDPLSSKLILPNWVLNKRRILNDLDKELVKKNIFQGFQTSILNKGKQILMNNIKKKDILIDATIGNGNDLLFLATLVPYGHVYGFDIQEIAIKNTNQLLKNNKINNYTLFKISHSNMLNTLTDKKGKIKGVIFNLGYLPKGNKSITTNYKTTIKALKDSLRLIQDNGFCLITIYPGHKEGKKEDLKIQEFLPTIKTTHFIKQFRNSPNPLSPYLILITKKHHK